SGMRQEAEERFTNPEGEQRVYWSARQPYTDGDGRRYLIGFSSDITELAELRDQLKVLAETDTLTGLCNRRMFFESGYREFLRSRRYGYPLSIVLMDVDHFKRINDTLGHPVGDQVLEHVAETLTQHVREQDMLARIGGEEFAVLLPYTDLRGAIEMAERLREAIAAARLAQPDAASVSVTVSLGVAIGRDEDTRLEDMLSRADKAMYEAKQRGRDQVCCHERF
ncbi:MAG: GGDEF domain-containing protein, partial [Lentisphaerae bacterium]